MGFLVASGVEILIFESAGFPQDNFVHMNLFLPR